MKKTTKNASWDKNFTPLGHGKVTNEIRCSSIFSTVSPRAPIKITRDPLVLYVLHCAKLYALHCFQLVLQPDESLRLMLSVEKLIFSITMTSN